MSNKYIRKKYKIAYVMEKNIWIMNDDGSEKKQITKTNDVSILWGWSDDNKKLLYGTGKTEIDPGGNLIKGYKLWILKIDESSVIRIAEGFEVWNAKYINDNTIFFENKDESIWEVNINANQPEKLLGSTFLMPELSPDKKKMVCLEIPIIDVDYDLDDPVPPNKIYICDVKGVSKKLLYNDHKIMHPQ